MESFFIIIILYCYSKHVNQVSKPKMKNGSESGFHAAAWDVKFEAQLSYNHWAMSSILYLFFSPKTAAGKKKRLM